MNVLTIGDKRLGAALLDMGLLEDEELQRALEQHREVGGTLSEVIVEMGLLSEKRIAQAVEETFGIPLVDLVNMQIAPEVLELLPAGKARSLGAIPFAQEGGSLRVALLNPLDNLVLEEIEEITSQMIEPYQTTRSAFNYALAKNYPELRLVVPEPPSTVSDAEVLLGEILVKKGYVSRDDLEAALQVEAQHNVALRPFRPFLDHVLGEEIGNRETAYDQRGRDDRQHLPARHVKHGRTLFEEVARPVSLRP